MDQVNAPSELDQKYDCARPECDRTFKIHSGRVPAVKQLYTKIRKTDVTIAKNYLRENEIGELNRIVSMYLDFAEDQAKRRKVLYMRDWREKLNAFLQFNERDVLTDAGRVEKAVADQLALDEYDKFHARRLKAEDGHAFDEAVKRLPPKKPRKNTP